MCFHSDNDENGKKSQQNMVHTPNNSFAAHNAIFSNFNANGNAATETIAQK